MMQELSPIVKNDQNNCKVCVASKRLPAFFVAVRSLECSIWPAEDVTGNCRSVAVWIDHFYALVRGHLSYISFMCICADI